uniref:carboxymuconolactone decarboxylase family protein n=1 Tax=Pedobacter schmidteae TaxID=2201271 RepID=UPI000EB26E76|nr:carboxymuconolactone decarboxylase family protein [Pedobacter schmidteae]
MERIKNNELPQGLMASMHQVEAYLSQCGLDHALLELMRLRVSQINGCAYCLDMHSKELLHAGDTVQRMISVSAWREAPYYSPKERAVLAFAELLTYMQAEAEADEAHEELLKYFNKGEIASLTLAIAQINSWNRIVKSTGAVAGNYQVKK